MELSTLAYFTIAAALLTIAPGPDNMYLLAKSLADGTKSGIALSFGLISGILFHTTLVMAGVAAFIQGNPLAMAALKYAGAAYLLYLSWKALRSKGELSMGKSGERISYRALYGRGVLMNVLNPKVLLFFLAFLPQFADLSHPRASRHIALLGLTFALQGLIIFSCIAYFAGHLRKLITGRKNIGIILGRTEGLVLLIIAMTMIFG